MSDRASLRFDPLSWAFFIGFVAFAIWPTERVLIGATIGSWAVLLLLSFVVIAREQASPRVTTSVRIDDSAVYVRERVIDALFRKAELLRAMGRSDEALSAYEQLIHTGTLSAE